MRHRSRAHIREFSPDGKLALTESDDDALWLWRRADGPLIRTLPHPEQLFNSIVSPDGQVVATVGSDHAVRLWDRATGRYRA